MFEHLCLVQKKAVRDESVVCVVCAQDDVLTRVGGGLSARR